MIRRRGSNLALAAALTALLMVVGFSGSGLRDKQRTLEDAAVENLFWTAAQVDLELQRFIATAARFAAGDPEATVARVRRRFDILWSRAALFEEGGVARRLLEIDGVAPAVDALWVELRGHAAAIDALGADDQEKTTRIISAFETLTQDVRRLATAVLVAEEARHHTIRASLQQAWTTTLVTLAGSLIIGLGLVGVSVLDARRSKRAARRERAAAERARAASMAKSRFIAVMSHDLRTPLNGLLGQVSLVRDSHLAPNERALIDNALSSGRQLSETLSEILAFCERDEQSERRVSVFRLASFVDDLAVTMRRSGVESAIELAADGGLTLRGDEERLSVTTRLLLRWAHCVAPGRSLRLEIARGAAVDGGAADARIVFSFDAPHRDVDISACDAPLDAISSGVEFARSLMELLRASADAADASLRIKAPSEAGLRLELSAPVQIAPTRRARLHIASASAAVASLISGLARAADIDVVKSAEAADLVVRDAPGGVSIGRPDGAPGGGRSRALPLDPRPILNHLRLVNSVAIDSSAGVVCRGGRDAERNA